MPLERLLYRSWQGALGTSLSELFWYAILAAAVSLAFYGVFRRRMSARRIGRHSPTLSQVGREMLHSLRSIAIFGVVSFGMVIAYFNGWTKIYLSLAENGGWTWFVLSIGVMVVIHDTYFYWTHRAMHHRALYRLFHRTHHLSSSPTPWAAYAFSPLEALVQAGIAPVILFTIPVHPGAFSIFMLWQISFNVLGHCGFEVFPSWFMRSRAGWLMNTITHHGQHHEKFVANFGLYFNVWDRVMGTNHASYEQRFEEVVGGKASDPILAAGDSLQRPYSPLSP